jgi:hypothetical protein
LPLSDRFTFEDFVDAVGGQREALALFARKGMGTRDEFIEALHRDVDEGIRILEGNANEFSEEDTGETELSSFIYTYLKGRGYNVSCEPHERGHVDIKVNSSALNLLWLAEAKKHGKYEADIDGVRQLLTRYSSGFDTVGAVILYVWNQGAAKVAQEFRDGVAADPICATVKSDDDGPTPFRFRTTHSHPASVEYTIRHHVVLLYINPQDKSGRARQARKAAAGPA